MSKATVRVEKRRGRRGRVRHVILVEWRLITLPQLAEALGFSGATARLWARNGKISTVRFAHRSQRYVMPKALAAFLKRQPFLVG